MLTIRKAFLESIVQSGSMMASRLSLVAGIRGWLFSTAYSSHSIRQLYYSHFFRIGAWFGFGFWLSLIAVEGNSEQRHLMLWVALSFPTFAILPVGLVIWLLHFWLDLS